MSTSEPACSDERALDDIGANPSNGPLLHHDLIEYQVAQKMNGRIEEREETEHPAVLNEQVPACQAPERSDRQGGRAETAAPRCRW